VAASLPGDILAPLGDFCPPQTCILGHVWDKKTLLYRRRPFLFFFRERLFLGQKDTSNPAKTFFLFIYFFLENACFWDKNQSKFCEEPYFALQTLALLVLPLPLS